MLSLFAFVLVLGIVVDDAHHRGREHLPAPGGARRRAARRDRGRPRDRPAGHLRGPDDSGGLQPAAVRGRHDGQAAPGHSARGHPVPAVLAAGVAEHPPGAPLAHPEARPPGAVAPSPVPVRERPEALRAARLLPRARRRAPLALPDGLGRRRRHDRDRRPGAVGAARLPLRSRPRGRRHIGLDDDAAGHAGRNHRGGGREARGGGGAAAPAPARGDRPGPLRARAGGGRRPAHGRAGRRAHHAGRRHGVVERGRGRDRARRAGAAQLPTARSSDSCGATPPGPSRRPWRWTSR